MPLPKQSITQVADNSQITSDLWNTPTAELLENDNYLEANKLAVAGGTLTGNLTLPENSYPADLHAVTKKWVAAQLAANGFISAEQRLYAIAAVVGKNLLPGLATGATLVTVMQGVPWNITTDTISSSSHGLSVGDAIAFTTTDGGVTAGVVYYVIASGFTTSTFKLSISVGGTPINLTTLGATTYYYKCEPSKYRWAVSSTDPDQFATDGWPLAIGDHIAVFNCQTYSGIRAEGLFEVESMTYDSVADAGKYTVTLSPVAGLNNAIAYEVLILNGQLYNNAKLTITATNFGHVYYQLVMASGQEYAPFDEALSPVKAVVSISTEFTWNIVGDHVHHHYCANNVSNITYDGVQMLMGDQIMLQYGSVYSHATVSEIGMYGSRYAALSSSTSLITLTNHGLTADTPVTFSRTEGGLIAGTTYYVISTGLTSSAFKVSLTQGGTAITLSANISMFVGKTGITSGSYYPLRFNLFRPPVVHGKRHRCDVASGHTHGGRTWRITPAYYSNGNAISLSGVRYEHYALTASL